MCLKKYPMYYLLLNTQNYNFYDFEKVNKKEARFLYIAMCVNASETPFLSSVILCFYVFKKISNVLFIIKYNRI